MLGRWPALPRVRPDGLTAHEGYLYVPSLSGLRVFDIRDPANRQQVMVPEAPQNTRGPLVVAGNRAYTAGHGLSVLDVSAPANPRMLGFLPVTEVSGNAIAVADQHVFILDAGSFFYPPGSTNPNPAGLHVVDVSDPAQPRKVSFLKTPPRYTPGYYTDFTDLIVSGGYAYAKLRNGVGSDIFDVRDPMKPTLVGNFPSYLLAVSGQRAYVSSSEGRLQIFDFSDPTNPVLLGTESTGSGGHDRMRLDSDLA
ncbi:MAG: LVIVD repeat-containing protein, partial [Fimbriimonas sp.]